MSKQENIELELTTGVFGEYELFVCNEDGSNFRQVAKFKNLITNTGLDELCQALSFGSRCSVGTGTTPPTTSDTLMVNPIAITTQVSNTVTQGTSPNWISTNVITYTFATGTAAGNLSEIGVGRTPVSTFNVTTQSRSLIVDGGGNPTTITILPTEILNVTYRISTVPILTDIVNTVSGYTFTIRPANVASWGIGFGGYSNNGFAKLCTSGLTTVDSFPNITGSKQSTSVGYSAYTIGTYFRNVVATWLPAEGAITAPTITMQGSQQYQIAVSPSIVKTVNDTVTFTFRHSIARI